MKRTIAKITDKEIKNNLKAHFNNANQDEIQAGIKWYQEAQEFCQKLSKKHNIESYKVAAVVSALSPNNKWERNKVDAEAVIVAHLNELGPDSVKVCTYNANKRKAFEILAGSTEITTKSPKTHAFAMNVGLNSPDHITVDKHHLRACMTHPSEGVTDTAESCTSVQYRRVEALTAEVAKEFDLKGYEFQAIVWLEIKRVWNR